MGAELRKKILEKLTIELLKTQGEMSEEGGKLVEAYYNSLSDDICHAIGTIDDISAPFIIVVLETLAESIRKLFPGHDETIEAIKELPRLQVIGNKRNRMLIFPIKAYWFKMIERGEKGEEYREDTPYYRSRLERYLGEEIECILRNGYSASSPQLKIRAAVEYGEGEVKWGADPGKKYFKLVISDVQRIQPETFIIKARRCKRCGGLLTSRQAVLDGYGHVCKQKAAIDEKNAELMKNQTSLFD